MGFNRYVAVLDPTKLSVRCTVRLFLNSIVCLSLCMRVTFVSGVFPPSKNAIFGTEPGVPEPDTTCPVPLHGDDRHSIDSALPRTDDRRTDRGGEWASSTPLHSEMKTFSRRKSASLARAAAASNIVHGAAGERESERATALSWRCTHT